MKRCRVHGVPLVVSLANVTHCRLCERETRQQIVTVSAANFKVLRDDVETSELVRSEER